MPSGEYTKQDRINEGCCWDYVRQLCPGGGCLCNCHATNEEILLSDCATLRRQVATLTSQLAARDAEVARLREHVLDAADCLDRVMGPRRPMTLPRKDEMRMAMDALRAALAAPTSGDDGEARDGQEVVRRLVEGHAGPRYAASHDAAWADQD